MSKHFPHYCPERPKSNDLTLEFWSRSLSSDQLVFLCNLNQSEFCSKSRIHTFFVGTNVILIRVQRTPLVWWVWLESWSESCFRLVLVSNSVLHRKIHVWWVLRLWLGHRKYPMMMVSWWIPCVFRPVWNSGFIYVMSFWCWASSRSLTNCTHMKTPPWTGKYRNCY